jgi:hypothetical protein
MEKLKAWTGFNKVKALQEEQAKQTTRLSEAFDRLDEALRPPPPKRERNGTD